MEDLLRSIPALLDQLGHNEVAREAFAFAAWRKSSGEGLRGKTAPLALESEKLIVAVRDLTWQKNLEALAGQMVYKVNATFRRQLITFIEFRIDEAAVEEESSRNLPKTDPPDDPPASEEITDEMRAAAEAIKDEGVRRLFLAAAGECLARKKRMSI